MVKEFLGETAKAQKRAANAREEWRILWEASHSVGSPKLAERVQTSHQGDLSEVVARLEEADAYADEVQASADKMAAVARRLISLLNDPDGEAVLRRRYLYGMKWETIAETMNYSVQWAKWKGSTSIMKLETMSEAKHYAELDALSML